MTVDPYKAAVWAVIVVCLAFFWGGLAYLLIT